MEFILEEFGMRDTCYPARVKRDNPKGVYKKRVFLVLKGPKKRKSKFSK